MELKGSQNTATDPCPEPDKSSPQLLNLSLKIDADVILASTPISSEWSLSFRFSN